MKGKIILKKVFNHCKSCQVEYAFFGAFTSPKNNDLFIFLFDRYNL